MQAEEAVSRIKVCLYRIALNYFLMLIAVHVDFDWFFFLFSQIAAIYKGFGKFYCHIMFWSKVWVLFGILKAAKY